MNYAYGHDAYKLLGCGEREAKSTAERQGGTFFIKLGLNTSVHWLTV